MKNKRHLPRVLACDGHLLRDLTEELVDGDELLYIVAASRTAAGDATILSGSWSRGVPLDGLTGDVRVGDG